MIISQVIVLCHGTWGNNLIQDAKEAFGLSNEFIVIPLTSEKSIEQYLKEVEEVVCRAPKECLIISDLYGGSTANVATNVGLRYGINAITGLSIQTILIADEELKKSRDLHDLSERIVKKNTKLCVDLISEFKKL